MILRNLEWSGLEKVLESEQRLIDLYYVSDLPPSLSLCVCIYTSHLFSWSRRNDDGLIWPASPQGRWADCPRLSAHKVKGTERRGEERYVNRSIVYK